MKSTFIFLAFGLWLSSSGSVGAGLLDYEDESFFKLLEKLTIPSVVSTAHSAPPPTSPVLTVPNQAATPIPRIEIPQVFSVPPIPPEVKFVSPPSPKMVDTETLAEEAERVAVGNAINARLRQYNRNFGFSIDKSCRFWGRQLNGDSYVEFRGIIRELDLVNSGIVQDLDSNGRKFSLYCSQSRQCIAHVGNAGGFASLSWPVAADYLASMSNDNSAIKSALEKLSKICR
jgi:hypothetical protein